MKLLLRFWSHWAGELGMWFCYIPFIVFSTDGKMASFVSFCSQFLLRCFDAGRKATWNVGSFGYTSSKTNYQKRSGGFSSIFGQTTATTASLSLCPSQSLVVLSLSPATLTGRDFFDVFSRTGTCTVDVVFRWLLETLHIFTLRAADHAHWWPSLLFCFTA